MPEPGLERLLAAAAGLLLRPPEPGVLEALARSGGAPVAADRARQDFYDVICMPASGRYIPPYAHVITRGREQADGWWHFPAPRFDGGDALAPWYRALGFEPLKLDIDPMLRGPHRALDQVGVMLAFLASAVASRAGASDPHIADEALGRFIEEHLGEWFDRYCDLLAGSGSEYLQAVADAAREAVAAARAAFPPTVPADERAAREGSGTHEALSP